MRCWPSQFFYLALLFNLLFISELKSQQFKNEGELKKEDIGLIVVKDFHSFVAVRKSKMSHTLHLIKNHRIKNQKVKIDIAR